MDAVVSGLRKRPQRAGFALPDDVKALALGADATMIGRPQVFALERGTQCPQLQRPDAGHHNALRMWAAP